ncbi:MAG: efflux RND transporter periplasmic adaptor subunit [Bacteroides sp.]|nr:efflux RND transporter periplasmic adaptor subunit [Bacteroides sp.]
MKTRIPLILLLAVIVSMTSCKHKETHESQGLPSIDVATAVVDSVVLYKTYPGYLSSDNSAVVVAQVDGMVLTQNFSGGQFVNKGAVLFTIDPTLYKDAVDRAEAQLASAISTRDYAQSHYAAVKKALEADAVSKMEVLNAESAYEQAEADIKNCRAALHTAQTNLGYCSVRAPLAGYISDSYNGAGTFVNGSGTPVEMAKIFENKIFKVVFEIEDSQFESMVGRDGGIGNKLYRDVPLHFRDTLLTGFKADLVYEAPSVVQSTGTIQLKGRVENKNGELKDGMYVTVSLPYGENPRAILVKDASIGTDQLGKYLYTVNDSNKVVYTPIEVGDVYKDSLRLVTKGIKPDTRYVTKALLTVRPGEEIKPNLTK